MLRKHRSVNHIFITSKRNLCFHFKASRSTNAKARHLGEIEFIALRISSLRLFRIVNKHVFASYFYYNFFLYSIYIIFFLFLLIEHVRGTVRSFDPRTSCVYIYIRYLDQFRFFATYLVSWRRENNFISNLIPIKEISRRNSILNCHREFSHRRGKDYRRNRKNVIFRIFLSHSQHVHAIVLDRRAKASSRSLERSRLVAITGEERSVISIRIILGGGGFFLHRGNPPLPPVPAISWSRSINSQVDIDKPRSREKRSL